MLCLEPMTTGFMHAERCKLLEVMIIIYYDVRSCVDDVGKSVGA